MISTRMTDDEMLARQRTHQEFYDAEFRRACAEADAMTDEDMLRVARAKDASRGLQVGDIVYPYGRPNSNQMGRIVDITYRIGARVVKRYQYPLQPSRMVVEERTIRVPKVAVTIQPLKGPAYVVDSFLGLQSYRALVQSHEEKATKHRARLARAQQVPYVPVPVDPVDAPVENPNKSRG